MLDLDLTGYRAIVTGGSQGIGAATVRTLADHGAAVAFCARSEKGVKALDGYQPPSGEGSARGYVADMGNADSVNTFLDAVEAEGSTDILVNNVGAGPSRNFLYMSDDDWTDLFELNLMSAVRCTRRCLPAMRKKKWGRVVMVASNAARYPGAVTIDYGSSKAAMVAAGKALAGKYGRDQVLVNSVLPGLIRTEMWEHAAQEISEARGGSAEDVFTNNSKSVPVGRYGTPEEVAAVILFLCSKASSYVNGVSFSIDGGQAPLA